MYQKFSQMPNDEEKKAIDYLLERNAFTPKTQDQYYKALDKLAKMDKYADLFTLNEDADQANATLAELFRDHNTATRQAYLHYVIKADTPSYLSSYYTSKLDKKDVIAIKKGEVVNNLSDQIKVIEDRDRKAQPGYKM